MSWGDKPELGALVAIPADCVNKSSGARQDGGEAWRRERKMRYGVGFAFFFSCSFSPLFCIIFSLISIGAVRRRLFYSLNTPPGWGGGTIGGERISKNPASPLFHGSFFRALGSTGEGGGSQKKPRLQQLHSGGAGVTNLCVGSRCWVCLQVSP